MVRTRIPSVGMSTTGHLTYILFPSDGSKLFRRMDVDPTVDGPVQNMTKDARKVVIEGAQRKEDEYTLDTTGFQFSRPKHTRFQDDKEIKAEYYPECMEIIKQLTGAARVIPFHHCTVCCLHAHSLSHLLIHDILAATRRRNPDGANGASAPHQPSSIIHVDFTLLHLPFPYSTSIFPMKFQLSFETAFISPTSGAPFHAQP